MKLDDKNLTIGDKDAVHIGVVIAKCDDDLDSCDWVRFIDTDLERVVKCTRDESHGIVNPWCTGWFEPGEGVPILVDPNLIEGMSHQFNIKDLEVFGEKRRRGESDFDFDCRTGRCG